MLYDMAVKKAQRLVGHNFQACVQEAHRLAALGLPISVSDDCIIITHARQSSWVNITQKGKANLSGADLSWTNLRGANLSRANLSGANLSGVIGLAPAVG